MASFKVTLGLIVEKEKVAANGYYNLSGDRYYEQPRLLDTKWPMLELGEICTFMTGGTPTSTVADYYENGTIPWLVSGDIHKFEIHECEKRITEKGVENSNARFLPKNSVLIALNGQGKTRGTVALLRMEGATCNQSLVAITPKQPPIAIAEFILWVLRSTYSDIRALTGDNERSGLNIPILKKIQIPLPPLEVQKEIVSEIEAYQKVIDGARSVLDNYRPHIPIHPDWPEISLGEVCQFIDYRGKTPQKTSAGIPLITAKNVRDGYIDPEPREFIATTDYDTWMTRGIPQVGDVLFTTEAPLGNVANITSTERFALAQRLIALSPDRNVLVGRFLKNVLLSKRMRNQIFANQSGTTVYGIKASVLKEIKVPVPPLSTQQAIVAEIEAEQTIVNANTELITRFEKKIQATLARVWG